MSKHNTNLVILTGNLTRDPEVRFTQGGTAVVNFGLASNRQVPDGQNNWKNKVTFVDVTMWGKTAEAFAKFHKKGQPAFIQGRLELEEWTDKQSGQKRSKLKVTAERWEFVSGSSERSGSEEPDSQSGAEAAGAGVDETPF